MSDLPTAGPPPLSAILDTLSGIPAKLEDLRGAVDKESEVRERQIANEAHTRDQQIKAEGEIRATSSRRYRRIVIAEIVVFAIDILLTLGIWRVTHNQGVTQRAFIRERHAAAVASCVQTNGARKVIRDAATTEQEIWQGLLPANAPPSAVAIVRDIVAKLEAEKSGLPTQDCSKVP